MKRIGICLTIIATLFTISVVNEVDYKDLNASYYYHNGSANTILHKDYYTSVYTEYAYRFYGAQASCGGNYMANQWKFTSIKTKPVGVTCGRDIRNHWHGGGTW